jgi:NAD(P)H-hydrate epimerase
VDVPSGVNADDGSVAGAAVRADETVTFGYRKVGTICYPGKSLCGKVVVADIGYPNGLCETLKIKSRCCTTEDFARIPKRSPSGNKGTFGKILIVAGSDKYCGAAILSCLAAYRMGAGMVKVVTHYSNKTMLCTQIPEALGLFYGENETEVPYGEEFVKDLEENIAWADVIAIGPGLSRDITAEHLLYDILQTSGDKRLVIDADALNLISEMDEDEKKCLLDHNMILTPHIKEMSRLTKLPADEILKHPKDTAADYANAYGCVVVLKDAVTISSDGTNHAYNLSGNSGMAVAGSGDVLTGILAAACAWGLPLFQTAAIGVFLHGMAGDTAAKELGLRAMTARDIAESLTFLKNYE